MLTNINAWVGQHDDDDEVSDFEQVERSGMVQTMQYKMMETQLKQIKLQTDILLMKRKILGYQYAGHELE